MTRPRPDTVNPSLWRQSQVIHQGGLFKVVDGLYQVRNNDIGEPHHRRGRRRPGRHRLHHRRRGAPRRAWTCSGSTSATSRWSAVIYTHTHVDHYGGVKGVVDPADVASGKVPIIAPGTIASFDKFAIGENVVAGNAMSGGRPTRSATCST